MDHESIRRASEKLTEIDELKKIDKFLANKKYKDSVHFVIRQHFGEESDTIKINERHTQKFIFIATQIIAEIEKELAAEVN